MSSAPDPPPVLRPNAAWGVVDAYVEYVCGGDTFGEPDFEVGADREAVLLGGGIMLAIAEPPSWSPAAAAAAAT